MLLFRDLLDEPDIDKQNVVLKRAFNYASEPVCVDGMVKETILILAIATLKLSPQVSLLDGTAAVEKLTNVEWQARCCRCIQFLHTHILNIQTVVLTGLCGHLIYLYCL